MLAEMFIFVFIILYQVQNHYTDGLVQERHNSSALAMELCLSCTDPSICDYCTWCTENTCTEPLIFWLSRMSQDNARQAPHSSILIEHDPPVIPYWAEDNTRSCNQSPTYWWNPVRCCYNAVSLLQNPHKRHSIARPWGRGMGCLLWFQNLIHFLPLSSQCRL